MRTESEIRFGVAGLLVLQLLVTFGAMGLVVRTSPAVDRIVAQHVSSLTEVQTMLAIIGNHDCATTWSPEAVRGFSASLERANLVARAEGEAPALGRVEEEWRSAVAGSCQAREQAIADLLAVAEINREQIDVVDRSADQLSQAGAWVTVLLGLGTFVAGAALIRRLHGRIAVPLGELEAVLVAVGRGDPYRRCKRLDASAEYGVVATRLNQLLDRRLAKEEEEDPGLANIDRVLLHHLLDAMPNPVVAVDTSGAILAASEEAMEILSGASVDALSDALAHGEEADGMSMIERVEPFGKADGFLITLKSRELRPMLEPLEAERGDTAIPAGPRKLVGRSLTNALQDRGAADEKKVERKPLPEAPPEKEDWERD